MSCLAKQNVLNAESVIRLHCPFQNCDKFYKNKKSLNEHLRLYPEHKPGGLPTSRKRVSLRQCAEKFLDDESNPYSRKQRVSELLNCLNDEELVDLVLPRIAKIVSPVDFLLHGTDGTRDFHSKLCKFRNELFLRFPELQALFCPEPSPSTGFYNQRQVFTEIVQKNKPYSCDWLLEIDNGSFFKDVVMPCVFRKQHSTFMEFSCGIVGSLAIGQKETQDVLRNKWGKKLEGAIGINPILSKDEIFGHLNDTRQELLKQIGLEFNEFGEVVGGHVDIEKYISLFLTQPGTQSVINTPNNCLIVMDYTDGFPWLKWSRHFKRETSVRVKLIEPYNLLSTVLTVALWLGNDDYETTKRCGHAVYKQLKELKTIKHPLTGQEIKIIRRTCGDGKERRLSTASSSAKSTYPIPEAPEHQSQLGNMKIICPEPVWTVSDAESCQKKFETELCGKAPTKEKRREFAKQNLGNTGRKNLNGTPLSEYYPGTAHLSFRSVETLCLRIAKIAAGKMSLFKLFYTDSDCIVPENIHNFPREGFFWFKPTKAPEIFL